MYPAHLLLSIHASRINRKKGEIQQNEYYEINANLFSGMPIVNPVANGPSAGRPDIEFEPDVR